jgi:hypothetical protein
MLCHITSTPSLIAPVIAFEHSFISQTGACAGISDINFKLRIRTQCLLCMPSALYSAARAYLEGVACVLTVRLG